MTNSAPSFYPAEQLAEARRLWDEGLSASQVAKAVGLNKNQIIGLRRRQGWPARPSPLPAKSETRNSAPKHITQPFRGAKAVQQALQAAPRPVRVVAPPPPPKPVYVAPKLSSARVCQWIEGDHTGPMCCKPAVLGESWCDEHGRVVFRFWDEKQRRRWGAREAA